jgi:hypothetical protein
MVIRSIGQAAGVTEQLQARVHLTSRALLAALYADGFVHFEQGPATTVVLPYGAGAKDLPWVHIAAGQAVWFASPGVALNRPSSGFSVGPGPVDPPGWIGQAGPGSSDSVRLLLPREADLLYGTGYQRVDVQQLRAVGIPIDGTVLRADALPTAPTVDRILYRTWAEANVANAGLNEAAGRYTGDVDLARKRDSRYSLGQFARLQAYLLSGHPPQTLRGVVFVSGALVLEGAPRPQILDGSLIVEGRVTLTQGASLDITHSAATRSSPGLLVLGDGGVVVTDGARLCVHGLVYADGPIAVRAGAALDVVGAVIGADYDVSFSNTAATTVIRYDPAVLGTPGLKVASDVPVVAWWSPGASHRRLERTFRRPGPPAPPKSTACSLPADVWCA